MSLFTQNLAICLCMIPLSLTANDMQDNFDRYSKTYETTAKGLIQSGKLNNKINPHDYTKEDINNVKAKEYYNNPAAMENASRKGFSHDKTAQAMQDLQLNGKSHIDADNPVYKQAAQTQEDADKILHDKTHSDYQCKEISTGCTNHTTTRTCQQSNHQNISCMRYPKVEIVTVRIPPKDMPFSGTGKTDYRWEPYHAGASFRFPYTGILKSFAITANGNWFGHFWIQIQPVHGMIDTRLYQQSISYNFNPIAVSVTAGQKGSFYADGREYAYVPNITIAYNGVIEIPASYKKEARITWVDTCNNVDHTACVKTKDQCRGGSGTRVIRGVPVTLNCWQYDLDYSCGYNKVDSCSALAKKCNYVSQRCIESQGSYCLTYEKTYNCIQQDCQHKELRCGNPNVITYDQKIPHGTSEDFAKAVSGLAGVSEAANDLKKSQDKLKIFRGHSQDCGEAALGLYDCCDGGGNIVHNCSKGEKSLKEARDKHIASFAGRYCAKDSPLGCLVYHQNWCIFDSKLTRIIQEQGRVKQLGISFGSGEHPNCQGLTPEQLQQIDFSKIDFSEAFSDMKVNNPSNKSIADDLINKYKNAKSTPQYSEKDKKKAQDKPLGNNVKY